MSNDANESSSASTASTKVASFMRIFGDVRASEVRAVLLLLANIFALLVGYYIIKTVREPLILASGGAVGKAAAAGAQALALALLIPLYSSISARVRRATLLRVVTLFFVICIQLFFAGSYLNRDDTAGLSDAETIEPSGGPLEVHDASRFEPVSTEPVGSAQRWRLEVPIQLEEAGRWSLFIAAEETARQGLSDVDVRIVNADGAELERATRATDVEGWSERVVFREQFRSAQAGMVVAHLEGAGTAPAHVDFMLKPAARLPWLGFAFYVWVGIFNVMIIAQFWSFANDLYRSDAGRRLFPVVAIGATAGAWVGSIAAGALFELGVDPFAMLQITAALLLLTLLFYHLVERDVERAALSGDDSELDRGFGFDLVFKNSYILLIAVLLVLLNLVNTTGEFVLGDLVDRAAQAAVAAESPADPDRFYGQFVGSFYGTFFLGVNALALILQAFVASRIVRYLGLRGLLFALPVIAFGAYGVVAFGAGLTLFRWVKTAENSSDYSLMNTAKAMLWLPTTREEKYKAKQAVDTFFVRIGDLLALGVFALGSVQLGFGAREFALVNLGLLALAAGVGVAILRKNHTLQQAREAPVSGGEK